MRRSAFWPLLCLGLLALTSSCSKTNNVTTSNNNVYSKKIDERGGTVGENGKLSVYIPGGAVDDEVLISIREAEEGDDYPPPPESLAGKVYVIEPLGLELAAKATVHLPFPPGANYANVTAIRSAGDGSWAPIPGGLDPDASTATFDTFTFSFFALEAPPPSLPGSGGAPTGPGSAGSTGIGGSGSGATGPGTGGNGSVEEFCAPVAAPEGTSSFEGDLGQGSFRAKDGFAAVIDEGDQVVLLLTLTEQIAACGSALAAGARLGPIPIPGGQSGLSLGLSARLRFPDGIEPGTYPREAQPDHIELVPFELGPSCEQMPSGALDSMRLTIDVIDESHMAGSLEVFESAGGPLIASGPFDVPMCPLSVAPSTPPCCVRP